MTKRFDPILRKCTHLLHGGDYNPDQWIRTPEIWEEDMRLMKRAHCNAVTLGIFAWSALEPREGKFTFDWLDRVMEHLAENEIKVIMSTPGGSKPAWLSRAYPEACRVNVDGSRQPHGKRHNHCRTSPVYREKCRIINAKIAQQYKNHPSLVLWHVSNEYNGEDCHCDLCYAAFRTWLKERYNHDLDRLNHAYWSSFWSHTYPDWDFIVPTDHGVHALMLDWERFKTAQTIDFFKDESAPLREITPEVPVTTNFMNHCHTLDYGAFAKAVDVVSWDSYPFWHEEGSDVDVGVVTALRHDQCRAMHGGKPFILMESVPSVPSQNRVKKRKEPGMHMLSSLQAVAHGSDSVLYFQWRKSRGCLEKFHGAVVDHDGREDTRVFREVTELGQKLEKLDAVVGARTKAEVAVIQDWENEWAHKFGSRVYLGDNVKYREVCTSHYRSFWEAGVPVDVIDQLADLSGYKLVVLPMAYMLRPGFADKLKRFVEEGGTAVTTYWSGIVDETDLCCLGGVPGQGLRAVFGVREEESQSYFPYESVTVRLEDGNPLEMNGTYRAKETCSVIHAEGAEVLATYADQYYAGTPAVTMKPFGKGRAYYMAARLEQSFHDGFYARLIRDRSLKRALEADLPEGVTAQMRSNGGREIIFVMNFHPEPKTVTLYSEYSDLLADEPVDSNLHLDAYGVRILERLRP